MAELDKITAKIKRLEDKGSDAKSLAQDLKKQGEYDLRCMQTYSDIKPHEWVCYKRKVLQSWLGPRVRGVKIWYECSVCGIKMVLRKDN
jgi:hypothetical protein